MAGVLFIIWIPCERYEQILSNKQVWETTVISKNKEHQQQAASSSDEEINFSNLKVSKELNCMNIAYMHSLSNRIPSIARWKPSRYQSNLIHLIGQTRKRLELIRKNI